MEDFTQEIKDFYINSSIKLFTKLENGCTFLLKCDIIIKIIKLFCYLLRILLKF